MGNKQKNSKNELQKNKIKNENIYLLCPNCFKNIPTINTFIEGENVRIKISCSCLEKNTYLIMNLIDYITTIKNFTNSNFCLFHEKINSDRFCINCENWLCDECFLNHSVEICENEYYNKNDKETEFCDKHNMKKIYLCKQCLIIFCKICFLHHNDRKKIPHKGANIETYLTEQKVKAKYNKYQLYTSSITELKNAMKNELLNDIYNSIEKDNKIKENNKNYITNFQDKYLFHKTINEQLKLLIELILKNCEYLKNDFVLNKKFVYDVIINTKVNKTYPKLDKNKPIIEQMKYFTNYIKANFLNAKMEYNLNLISKIENSNSFIEKMLALTDNKFASINKDCEINIFKINIKKNKKIENLYSFNAHTNNITCIILLKNKKYFATASDDSTIKIWDSEKGTHIKTINVEGKPFIIYEKFGNDNAIGCVPNRNSISIYKYDDKSQNVLFNKSLEKTIPWIEGLYQLPTDGKIIISSSGYFQIFSSDINEIKKVYIANSIPQHFLQVKNEDLVVGLSSEDVFIYDKNLDFKRKLVGHKKNITSFLQLDEDKLLTASLDSHIILWKIGDYEMIFNFINNNLGINAMISINEYKIITCSFYKVNFIEEWEIDKNDNYDT